jgi:hypothetical protein
MATAYAVWSGVLTPTQAAQACKWFELEYDSPDRLGSGRKNMLSFISKARGMSRWIRWSEDAAPGYTSVWLFVANVGTIATWRYAYFINGGYLDFGILPVTYALSRAAPAKAQTWIEAMIDDLALDASGPYEKASGDNPPQYEGALYVQGTPNLKTATDPAVPLAGDRSDASTMAASQDAAYQTAGRLTVSAGSVVSGKVALGGHRIHGSVVYVSH